jgi:hypothetical protein
MINGENKSTSNIKLGTLYEMNKNLVEKQEKILTKEELTSKKEIIIEFAKQTKNHYYMMLCHDRRDYTVFTLAQDTNDIADITSQNTDTIAENLTNIWNNTKEQKLADIIVDVCLFNRGDVKGIDLTEAKDAIEIWISIDGESYCYYFFPYDAAIVEV